MDSPGIPDDKSAALLDALVDYCNEQLSGELFVRWVHEEVRLAMIAAEKLTLSEVVSPQQVRGVAVKYALEWRFEDTFVDLLSEIAVRIHDRLFDPESSLDLENGVKEAFGRLENVPAFQRLIGAIYQSEFVRRSSAALVYQAAVDALKKNRSVETKGLGRVLQLTGGIVERILPDAEQRADAFLHGVAEQLATMVQRDKTDPADIAHNIVAAINSSSDGRGLTTTIEASDIEDFLLVAFELLRDVRTTRPIRTAIEEGINVFFERNANYTLAQLLLEMGITAEDMIEEALRFAPRAIAASRKHGILDEVIRRRFRGFAESDRVKELLGD
ncbi:MAG: hypothetical protein LLG14_00760 [Nocardiaceae bacterium]|nr:hypothetical protein [Nocardiaceae bacterium]